jgi:hypothetical protein
MAVPVCAAIMIIVTLVRMGDFLQDRRKK